MKLNKVFSKSEEKYVKNFVVYAKSNNDYVYSDEACTTKIPNAELQRMFIVGCVVSLGGAYYKPVACSDAAKSITIVTSSSNNPTLKVLYAEEHA